MLEIMTLPVTPIAQNCRVLVHPETQDAVVVDPGGEGQTVAGIIKNQDLHLKAILLTHGHIDHCGAVAELRQQFDEEIPVIGPHQAEAELLTALPQQATFFGLKFSGAFEPQYVSDGQVLKLFEDASLTCLHTPGHTPGGICYYCAEERFVLVGDTIFLDSIGRTDLPGGDTQTLFASIKSKLLTLPDDTDVFCGHGDDTNIGRERRCNPYLCTL